MKTFERTLWLTFQLDLRRASPRLWILLGEAQSKVEHIAGVPLLPAIQDHLSQLFLAKGIQANFAWPGCWNSVCSWLLKCRRPQPAERFPRSYPLRPA